MYYAAKIANRIKICAKSKKIAISTLVHDCGLGVNAIGNMTSGRMPAIDSVAKIADVLNVSLDYLAGRTNTPTTELTEKDEKLLGAYHNHPELQAAIDRMLEIDSPESKPFDKPKEAPFKGRLIAYGGTNIGEPDDDDEPRIT